MPAGPKRNRSSISHSPASFTKIHERFAPERGNPHCSEIYRMMMVSVSSNIALESATRVVPSGKSADRSKPSLDALTGLRFLAAMGVVFFHFSLPILKGRSEILSNLAGAGYIAVDLFYLLSGFILTYSY